VDRIGPLIRQRRERLGLTLSALADAVGATKGYLSMIENGKVANPPSAALLGQLERALGIGDGELRRAAAWQRTPEPVRTAFEHVAADARRAGELLRWLEQATEAHSQGGRSLDSLFHSGELARRIHAALGEPAEDANTTDSASAAPATTPIHITPQADDPAGPPPPSALPLRSVDLPLRYRVPLINQVAAGYPTDFTDLDYPARVADSYVTCPDIADPTAFAARVVGDSMLPDYREGDVVVFSPEADITDGSDCFVRLEPDHETTFKRIFFEPDDHLRLQPLNARFAARLCPREEVAGLYRAVWRLQRIG